MALSELEIIAIRAANAQRWPGTESGSQPGKKKKKKKKVVFSDTRKRRRILWDETPSCYWCFRQLTYEESTVDHLLEKSNGGTSDESNLVIACSPCNNYRTNNPKGEYWKRILGEIETPNEVLMASTTDCGSVGSGSIPGVGIIGG